jgi:hypothetical protein
MVSQKSSIKNKKIESFVRKYWLNKGNKQKNIQVEIIDGNKEPHIVGNRYDWKTKGGKTINHPSAYSKIGWSNMVYHHSTRRLCVGREWLENNSEAREICWLGIVKG